MADIIIEGKQIADTFFEKGQWYLFDNYGTIRYLKFKGFFPTKNEERCLITSIGFTIKAGSHILDETTTTAPIPLLYKDIKSIIDQHRIVKITEDEVKTAFKDAYEKTFNSY